MERARVGGERGDIFSYLNVLLDIHRYTCTYVSSGLVMDTLELYSKFLMKTNHSNDSEFGWLLTTYSRG